MKTRNKKGQFKRNLTLEARRHLTLSREINEDLEGTGKSPIIVKEYFYELDDFYFVVHLNDGDFAIPILSEGIEYENDYMFADEKPFSPKWMEKKMKAFKTKIKNGLPLDNNDRMILDALVSCGFELYTDGTFWLKSGVKI